MVEVFLKVLEVGSINHSVDLQIPPTFIFGFGIRKLTYIHHFSTRVLFTDTDLPSITQHFKNWPSFDRHPVALLKTSAGTQLLYAQDEPSTVLSELLSAGSSFYLQQYIVSSESGAQLIRVTLDSIEYPTCKIFTTYIQFTSALEAVRASRLRMQIGHVPPKKIYNPKEFYLVKDDESECLAVGLTKISHQLLKYARTARELVGNYLASAPVKTVELDFVKKLNGGYYFLKVNKYTVKNVVMKKKELGESRCTPSQMPSKLSKCSTLPRPFTRIRIRDRQQEVVNELVQYRNPANPLKYMTYKKWVSRKDSSYLELKYAKSLMGKARSGPPQHVFSAMKELISRVNKSTIIPTKIILEKAVRLLLERVQRKKLKQRHRREDLREKSVKIAD